MIKKIDLKELYMGFDKPSNVDESLARINQKIEIIELKINEVIETLNLLSEAKK